MNRRQVAEILIVARKNARRIGANFSLNHFRLIAMGLTGDDIAAAERAVDKIELFTEQTLAGLDNQQETQS